MAGRGTAMSVRTRLALFTALLVALMLAIGTIAVVGDQAASERVRLQSRSLTPTLQANAELQSQLRRAESSVANYLLLRHALAGASGTPDDVAQVLAPARDALRDIPAQLSGIDHFLSMPPFDDAELVGDLADRANSQRASMTAWREWALAVVPELGEAPLPLPSAAEVRRGEALFQKALGDSSAVQASLASTNAGIRQEVLDMLDRARGVLVAATLIAVALALFVAWRTSLRLVGPIRSLGETLRRQVAGERLAWADTETGAQEIRELAEDVNVLNREHLRLVDRQAQSLALLRAGNDVVATLAGVHDPQEAVDLVADTIGRTLGLDTTRIAGWSTSSQPYAAVWSRNKAADVTVPETWWRPPGAGTPLLPPGEMVTVGSAKASSAERERRDVGQVTPAWVKEDPVVAASTSSLFLPIAVGATVNGLLSVHSTSDVRAWDEPEIAYLQRVTRELARFSAGRRDA